MTTSKEKFFDYSGARVEGHKEMPPLAALRETAKNNWPPVKQEKKPRISDEESLFFAFQ